MIIAVASGKGGTGKTSVSVSLAKALADSNKKISLLDCDVEEPNAHLLLECREISRSEFNVKIPSLDLSRCTGCGKCAEICEFNCIAIVKKRAVIFPDLCHSCGGCSLVCPEKCIKETDSKTGEILEYNAGIIHLVQGILDIGKAMAPPLIREVKKLAREEIALIDCPPGTSCPMVTAVGGADYVILVTEPTPFGLHDMTLAVETLRKMKMNFYVIINRADSGDDRVEKYCTSENIEVIMRIKESIDAARAYSKGIPLYDALPEFKQYFILNSNKIISRAGEFK
ncbi:MAG TPA: ATP-binding protein [Spirochaetota bacterium]|nr:ATP-binding protein [Spirochaetota bacterium]HOR44567.1 ATP-binding protein [Spirochaetota bacterium]HPK55982.1 ATP-binding protein [Spirochaetota bacterium]